MVNCEMPNKISNHKQKFAYNEFKDVLTHLDDIAIQQDADVVEVVRRATQAYVRRFVKRFPQSHQGFLSRPASERKVIFKAKGRRQ